MDSVGPLVVQAKLNVFSLVQSGLTQTKCIQFSLAKPKLNTFSFIQFGLGETKCIQFVLLTDDIDFIQFALVQFRDAKTKCYLVWFII